MAYENVIIAVVVIAALIFGAKEIPKLARSIGKARGEYEKGRIEAEKELKDFKDKEELK
jgi:sec-independent protein translocase protein TatA